MQYILQVFLSHRRTQKENQLIRNVYYILSQTIHIHTNPHLDHQTLIDYTKNVNYSFRIF